MTNTPLALFTKRNWTARALRLGMIGVTLAISMLGSQKISASEATGPLITARYAHTATRLPDGQILVAGGHTVSGSISSMTARAEIYNPSTGVFSSIGSLVTARGEHAAASLLDGRVLVVGGLGFSGGGAIRLASTEIYDPATATWTVTGTMGTARRTPIALTLRDGRVLIIGGDATIVSCEIFDPATGSFSATGALTASRGDPAAVVLNDGRVLVAGGSLASGAYTSSAEIWDPATGIWSPTGSMIAARARVSTKLLMNGKVLVAGGNSSVSFPRPAELYDPATATFTATGDLNIARTGAGAVLLDDGNIIVTGGTASTWMTEGSIERYDVITGTWRTVDWLLNARHSHTTSLLTNGKVLIAGGAGPLSTAEIFDPACALVAASIFPTSQSFSASGGTGNVSVSHQAGCAWRVTGTPSWMTITSGSSGRGNGSVTYSIAANTGYTRGVTPRIANNNFTVSQAGNPCSLTPSISPASQSFTASGGTGSVAVSHQTGCAWTVTGAPSWMTITAGSSGSGNGSVTYSVSANTGFTRSATVSIANNNFGLSQAAGGNACDFVGSTTPGVTYSGALSTTDCTAGARGPSYYTDRYSFNGAPGQQIAIQLSSSAFDTYVYLRNPSGTVIASNDDGGGGLNSRIPAGSGYFMLSGVTGTYVIEVTSYAQRATGPYTLLRMQQ